MILDPEVAIGLMQAVEIAQLAIGGVGLWGALGEVRAARDVQSVGDRAPHHSRRRIMATHVVFIEGLRILVHLLILTSATLGMWLPAPPAYMGQPILEVILFRQVTFLIIAVVAALGTWASRWTRRRLADLAAVA